MIKQSIVFEDFDGKEVTEDHYFHLSKAELIEMELTEEGGMVKKLETIVKSGDAKKIIATFKEIISASYGQRDPVNATKFVKSAKISEEFMGSLAFDAFFSQLMTDPVFASSFVNGVVPKDLAAIAAAAEKKSGQIKVELPKDPRKPLTDPAEIKAALEAGVKAEIEAEIRIPDPNGLDVGTGGTWPAGGDLEAEMTKKSGLDNPFDVDGGVLPWALREPTERELMTMNMGHMHAVYRRKTSGWTPPTQP